MRIGLIGLGQMGTGIAANILKAGYELTVYNRTRAKSEAFADHGAKVANHVADACHGDAVITMLSNDDAVESAVYGHGGVLESLPRNAIHVSCSTISSALSKRLADHHAGKEQRYVAAPVFGRPEAAASAKLFVVAAGSPGAIETMMPVFEVIGQRTFTVSEDPTAANIIKLSGNFLIASVIESLGEAMALVGKAGIDKHQYLELLTSALFGAPVYKTYGTLIADEKFSPPGFAAPLGLNDVRLALAAGDDLRVPLPLASLLRDRYLTLLANGGDDLDWSAIGALAAKDAGLK